MVDFKIDTEHPITIPCEDIHLEGLLHIPKQAQGIVIFVHGSGSSRFSPRNQFIARELQHIHFATLLFDLLTPQEEVIDDRTAQLRFDIPFLAKRLVTVTQWVKHNPLLKKIPVGYFGASTGGGAALVAAAQLADLINAIVSRGGRPDLAGESLRYVEAPTLFIVGGDDDIVIALNKKALAELHCEKKLEIVPGATHLFEEPGKLEQVAELAKEWFKTYLNGEHRV